MVAVSIFIGDVRPLPVSGRPTGIYKTRVSASIAIGSEGFQGDRQADRRVHGGPDKAVHLYPTRHYARLADEFPQVAASLVPGSIGENLATDAPTLREAMQLCSAHRPPVQQLERLARVPGIAGSWRDKIVQRIAWLRSTE